MAEYRTVRIRIKPLTRKLSALECARMGVHIDRIRASRIKEHAAGDVAGGSPYVPGPGNSSAASRRSGE